MKRILKYALMLVSTLSVLSFAVAHAAFFTPTASNFFTFTSDNLGLIPVNGLNIGGVKTADLVPNGYFKNLFASTTQFTKAGGATDFGGFPINDAGVITATNFIATSTTATSTFSTGGVSIASGGYLALSGMTPGSVIFAGGGGTLSQNNAQIFWDNTNNRLGIGTSTPGTILSVQGVANFTGATSTFQSTGGINITGGCLAVNGTCVQAGGSGSVLSGTTGQVPYYASNGTTLTATSSVFINTNQNVGIGTTSPSQALSVLGNGYFTGNLTIGGFTQGSIPFAGAGGLLSQNNSQLFWDNTNNRLGIGTAVPSKSLEIDTQSGTNNTILQDAVGNNNATTQYYDNNTFRWEVGNVASTHDFDFYSAAISNYSFILKGDSTGNILLNPNAGKTGIASSTPWALLSVNPNAIGSAPSFVVGSSSATWFEVNNGGSVGIGTTSPSQLFSVSGSGYLTGGLGVGIATTTAGLLQTSGNVYAGANLVAAGTTGTSTIALGQGFTVGNNQFLVQQSSGYVGIGVTNPTAQLNVSGAPNTTNPNGVSLNAIINSTGIAGLDIDSAGGSFESYTLYSQAGNNKWSTGMHTDVNRTFYIRDLVNTLDRVSIPNNGNVGIGSTTPITNLSVLGAANTNYGNLAVAASSGSNDAGISLLTGGNSSMRNWQMQTNYNQAGDFVLFRSTSNTGVPLTTTLEVDTNGNLGIGTSTPGSLLSINGIANFTSATSTTYSTGGINLTGGGCFAVNGTCTTNISVPVSIANGGTNNTSAYTAGSVIFSNGTSLTQNNTQLFWDNTNNRLGIGTAAPSYNIDTNGNTSSFIVNRIYNTNSAGSSRFVLGNDSSSVNGQLIQNGSTATGLGGSNALTIYQSANAPIIFNTSTVEQMRLTGSGLLGIGTSTPNWLLDVAGTRPSFDLTDTAAGTNLKHWLHTVEGGNMYIGPATDAYATTSPSVLGLTNAGVVSMSTTTALGALDIGATSANGSSTIFMGKVQFDGYREDGARICLSVTAGNTWRFQNGACVNP